MEYQIKQIPTLKDLGVRCFNKRCSFSLYVKRTGETEISDQRKSEREKTGLIYIPILLVHVRIEVSILKYVSHKTSLSDMTCLLLSGCMRLCSHEVNPCNWRAWKHDQCLQGLYLPFILSFCLCPFHENPLVPLFIKKKCQKLTH